MAEKKLAAAKAIHAAVEHFKAQGLREITVPEWNDLTFYVTPFTLQEQGKLQFEIKNGNEADALAAVVVMKAIDQEGNKLFDVADKQTLRTKVDATVLARVANDIIGEQSTEVLEGN